MANTNIPEYPITNKEQYLNRIATGDGVIPDHPVSRIEHYLDYIVKNGGSAIKGYYYDGQFYKDIEHTQLIEAQAGKFYYDLGGKGYLFYDGSSFGQKADLVGGKVPISQLPSYVSEVVEVATYQDLPEEGENNVIYVVKNENNQQYRWSGTGYIKIGDEKAYYAVAIPSTMTTMGQLEEYIAGINEQGLHIILDMHNYISDAYVCTAHFYVVGTEKHCEIFDLLNTQLMRGAYTDSTTISAFVATKYDIVDTSRAVVLTFSNSDSTTTVFDFYGSEVVTNE